jgi:hypothetical protein
MNIKKKKKNCLENEYEMDGDGGGYWRMKLTPR